MAGLMKKSLGNSGLPKAADKPALKPVGSVKGIAGVTGGSIGAGDSQKKLSIKGFGKA